MDKKQIHDLLLRYLKGECDEEEAQRVQLWYKRLNKAEETRLSEEEKELLEDKLWDNIRVDLSGDVPLEAARKRWRVTRFFYSGVAAAVLVMIGLAWYPGGPGNTVENGPEALAAAGTERVSRVNDTGQPVAVSLEDGSRVTLLPGSRLEYPGKFGPEKREVILQGNAFFEIASNPEWPFCVHNGKLVTRVLGTSFWIRTHEESRSLEVEVVSGKVSVFEASSGAPEQSGEAASARNEGGVVLTPNQRVTYYPENGYLLTGLVEEPVAIRVPRPVELVFDDEGVREIVTRLQKKFGVEIVLAYDRLEECTFTGDINGLSLYDALEVLCKSIGAEYEIKSTRILINGSGCDG